MPLCLQPINPSQALCQRPHGHSRQCDRLPTWKDLQPDGMAEDQQVSDKVTRSPTETAGKGGEWGFLQNKVSRASQVAIPLNVYIQYPAVRTHPYDAGFLVYVTPNEHFSGAVPATLVLGRDYIVLYTSDTEIHSFPPLNNWNIFQLVNASGQDVSAWNSAASWKGEYYVRVKRASGLYYAGGTAKAIGIRQDEYCSRADQRYIVGQMSYLAWSIPGTRTKFGVNAIPQFIVDYLTAHNMLDLQRMRSVGMLNASDVAQCPFCREELSFQELINQAPQQVGRQLSSSNATALHLMHIDPLKMGLFNHRPYNLAFGHAKCNHAQGEDSITQSIDFLFTRRLMDALSSAGISVTLQAQIKSSVLM